MSGRQPATPQQRELEIMRVLFERSLKDRAIALADSRWPGSGQMVSLAYEWGQLSPEQRRQQLSNIGPEEIARYREFAELNPGLAAAIDELDRRGALPHIEAAAVDIAAATREASESASSGTGAATSGEADPAQTGETADEIEAEAVDTSQGPSYADPDPIADLPETDAEPVAETPRVDAEPVYGFEDHDLDALDVDMPDLDLGLPSTEEVLKSEEQRREESARATEESMERVRQRLEHSAQRAFDRGSAFTMPRLPDIPRPTLPSATPASSVATGATRAIEAPRRLAREFEEHVVVSLRPDDPQPSDDELLALANDLQIGLSEHLITYDNRREEFGGLVNEFGRISTRPGRLARAVAHPNLVVVRGRMTAQLASGLEEGYFDIPGTRTSVKLHPKTRVLLIGS